MRVRSARRCALAVGLVAAAAGCVAVATAPSTSPTASAAGMAPSRPVAYPLPGTTTANPRTQISFRGLAPDKIGTVTVTGSRSGRHSGSLRAHSDRLGASFVPVRPFSPGERVAVRSRRITYSFTIGRRPARVPPRPSELPDVGRGAVQRFSTRGDIVPPAVTVTKREEGRAPGLVFLAPKAGRGQDGPMIIDDFGNLVWFHPSPNRELATDFRVQTYQGQPVLTWWQGRLSGGEGEGEGVLYDTSYQPVRRVRAGNGFYADGHEFQLTDHDTALLIAYDPILRDLSHIGGRGSVVQAVIQEIDIATGLVLFEWHSLGNIAYAESHQRLPQYGGKWDYVHPNSVDLDADGDFILSARHTSTVYKISRTTGRIVWRLNGKDSDFKMGPGTSFFNQHDARVEPDGNLTLFDNASPPPKRKASRGLTLKLDTQAMTATLVSARTHPLNLLAATQGGAQRLPNGNLFVGWGSQRYFSEFDANGNVVFDGEIAPGGDNYRAYRFPWTGRPTRPPDLIAARDGDRVRARVSWNGATGVASWELWAGPSREALARVKGDTARGFETAISAATPERYVAVRALDAAGTVLGTSATVDTSAR